MIAPEVNYFRTFSVLFFPVTVIWRETRHSGCVNGSLSPSTFLLCKQQQLDDLFSEFSVPTGGLFQPNFFLSSRFRTTFWSWTTPEAVFLSPCFHFQINKIFLSCICTRTTLTLCKNNYSKKNKAALRGYFWLHGDGHKREIQTTPPPNNSTLSHSAHGASQPAIFTSFPSIHRCCSLDWNIPAATSPSHYPSWNIKLVSPW